MKAIIVKLAVIVFIISISGSLTSCKKCQTCCVNLATSDDICMEESCGSDEDLELEKEALITEYEIVDSYLGVTCE